VRGGQEIALNWGHETLLFAKATKGSALLRSRASEGTATRRAWRSRPTAKSQQPATPSGSRRKQRIKWGQALWFVVNPAETQTDCPSNRSNLSPLLGEFYSAFPNRLSIKSQDFLGTGQKNEGRPGNHAKLTSSPSPYFHHDIVEAHIRMHNNFVLGIGNDIFVVCYQFQGMPFHRFK
jgi:hypothetical protein